MSFAKPTSLALIACPGAEDFTDRIVADLKRTYQRRFAKKARLISATYGMDTAQAYQEMNKADDLTSHRVTAVGNAEDYRIPAFRVPCKFTRFANSEVKTEILHSVRGHDVFIVQDVANVQKIPIGEQHIEFSINDHIMTLMTTIDASRHAGARRISLVLPTYPYSRQHKKKGREGLTASMVGRMWEMMEVSRVITLDIHSPAIDHTFSTLRLENLHASYQILRTTSDIVDLINEDLVIVSPDTGSIDRNKFYADCLKKPLALLYKERDYSRTSKNAMDSNITNVRLLGDVDGKTVFIADDMLGTGGTLIKAMKVIRAMGAQKIICSVSLPFFSGEALFHFKEAHKAGCFDYIIGTNAVHLSKEILSQAWYRSADVSHLFSRSISRIHHNRSVSPLLDNREMIERMLTKQIKDKNSNLLSEINRPGGLP